MDNLNNADNFRNLTSAACGDNGPDQQRIAQTVLGWGNTLLKKNTDYGSSVWKVPVLAPDCSTSAAIRVRMSDKIARIEQLLKSGKSLVDESLEDSIRDLGSYCLLLLAAPKEDDNFLIPDSWKGQYIAYIAAEDIEVGHLVYIDQQTGQVRLWNDVDPDAPKEPIPHGVRYCPDRKSFFTIVGDNKLSSGFYDLWIQRADEFPQI